MGESRRLDLLAEMRAARDRAARRLDTLDHEVTHARREVDDWNKRLRLAERRENARAAKVGAK